MSRKAKGLANTIGEYHGFVSDLAQAGNQVH